MKDSTHRRGHGAPQDETKKSEIKKMKNIRTEQEKNSFETAMKISAAYEAFVLKYGKTLLRDAAFFALLK